MSQLHTLTPSSLDSTAPATEPSPTQRVRLLTRVAEFYQRTFLDTPEGLRYLAKTHGLQDVTLCKTFQVGYANGSLLQVLPQSGETVAQLQTLGVLDTHGVERFLGCVVFPLWSASGVIEGLQGLRLADGAIIRLPGEAAGLWNGAACQRISEVLVVASILEALLTIDAGFPDVLPLLGDDVLNADQLAAFQLGTATRVVVAAGADSAAVVEQLSALGKSAAILALPEGQTLMTLLHDASPQGRQALRGMLMSAFAELAASESSVSHHNSATKSAAPSPLTRGAEQDCQRTAQGFRLRLAARCYEVKGIARETTQLKATVKASGDSNKGFEVTTLDLYSSRSRDAFVKRCAALFGQQEKLIASDFARLIEEVEAWQPPSAEEAAEVPLSSPEDEARALAFLGNPRLFEELLADLVTLGIAGEETNKLVAYLASVSRKLDDPLSLMIQSRSAAGKSTLQHAVLSLTPPEDQVHYTRLTSQSLFYQGETSLAHKVLALEEAEGLGEAAYSLRALQSAKRITVATTVKDPLTGKMKTESYEVQRAQLPCCSRPPRPPWMKKRPAVS